MFFYFDFWCPPPTTVYLRHCCERFNAQHVAFLCFSNVVKVEYASTYQLPHFLRRCVLLTSERRLGVA